MLQRREANDLIQSSQELRCKALPQGGFCLVILPRGDKAQAVAFQLTANIGGHDHNGIFEADLYEGMKETLEVLKKDGFKLAVATLKAEKFAKQMLQNMGVADLFDVIHGVDMNDSITKSGLVNLCLRELNVNAENAVLVGDSIHDYLGAKESGVDFIPVMYGFGFKTEKEQETIAQYKKITSPCELIPESKVL